VTSTPTKNNRPSSGKSFLLRPWVWIPLALIFIFGVILTQVDLESVKEKLVQRISQETGLQVSIDSMGFGFSPGLGLQGKGVKVSTPDGKRFSVDRLHLLAEWGPLLKGELNIKSIALEHPEVTLELSKIPSPEVEEKPSEKPLPEPGLIALKTLKTTTEKLKNNRLSIEKLMVSDGKITLIQPDTKKSLSLSLDGTFILNRNAGLDISAKSVKVQTGPIILEGDGSASNLTAENAGISLNLTSGEFSWEEIQPILQFFGDPAKEALASLKAVDVDQFFIKTQMPLNSLSQIESLKEKMNGQVEFKIQNAVFNLEDKKYSVESLQGKATWEKGVLTHGFSGSALGSDFSLNGKFPFATLDKDSLSNIEWKNLALEKLPLPKEWGPTKGNVSGKISLTGPLPNEKETFPGRLNGNVEFQAENLVLKPNEANPIALSRLQGHGDFKQGVLTHEISGNIWGSEFDIQGKLPLNQNKPVINSQINWKGLNLAQLPLPSDMEWNPREGTLSGALTLAGPLPVAGKNFSGKLKGSFELKNLKLENKGSPVLSLNQLEGSGEFKNHQVNYTLKGDPFKGTLQSEGRIILPASGSGSPVLNNRIEFSNLDLSQLPTPGNQGNVSGTIKLNGPLPESGNFLTGKLNIDTTFKVTDLKMSAGTLPLDIRSLDGKGNLRQGKLTHDLSGILFGGTLKTKGILGFQEKQDKILVTANSDLIMDQVKLDWVPLTTENEWAPTSGTVTGNLKIKGPLPSDGKVSPTLKLKGTLNGNKLVLGNPQKQIENLKLAFKESSSKLTQVQVDLEKIQLADRTFKKVSGLFQITPEKIDLAGGRVWPMNGLINLVGNLKPESGSYQLKFKGDKLKVEEFLSPHLTGPLQISGALEGKLPQNTATPGLPDYSRDLSGNVKIRLVNGTLPELGMLKNVLTLLNPTSALGKSTEGMACELLQGDFKIVKGVVHTSNLEMKSPQLTMNVKGKANLVEDTVLAQVKAMPLQMLDKTLKAIPLLGQILTGGKKGGLIETYFKVEGKLSQPDVTMQAHKSLLEKPGSILNELINIPGNLSSGK
jgi:hypothetical protein